MKCSKCGFEIPNNSKVCPQCGAKLKNDKFPTWVIVLLIVFVAGLSNLPVIGVVADTVLPSLVASAESSKNKLIFKKSVATLNTALLMSEAKNERYYSRFDDVWEKAIKSNLLNPQDIPNGIIFADGTEIKYERLGNPCQRIPQNPSVHTACAILTIDINGFKKAPNTRTAKTTGSYTNVKDQFRVLLYSDITGIEKGTPEYDILKEGSIYHDK